MCSTCISSAKCIVVVIFTDMQGVLFGTHRKKILKGISAYFNPKELIAIMGPSGEQAQSIMFPTLTPP